MKLFVCVVAAAAVAGAQPPPALVFRDVTVIDATGTPPQPGMTVLIRAGRIEAVGKNIGFPKSVQVVEGSGKFLVPGFGDMHVHWYEEQYLPVFIANGVTGMRQMWGRPVHHDWRKRIAEGGLAGPRSALASSIVDGPKPYWRASVAVESDSQARLAVIRAKQEGADFVKVYSYLTRPTGSSLCGIIEGLAEAAGHAIHQNQRVVLFQQRVHFPPQVLVAPAGLGQKLQGPARAGASAAPSPRPHFRRAGRDAAEYSDADRNRVCGQL